MEEDIKNELNKIRTEIKKIGDWVNVMHRDSQFDSEETSKGQHSEMHANITLAYRHLEDARMRIGKVIQAYDGGVSCYDK